MVNGFIPVITTGLFAVQQLRTFEVVAKQSGRIGKKKKRNNNNNNRKRRKKNGKGFLI